MSGRALTPEERRELQLRAARARAAASARSRFTAERDDLIATLILRGVTARAAGDAAGVSYVYAARVAAARRPRRR